MRFPAFDEFLDDTGSVRCPVSGREDIVMQKVYPNGALQFPCSTPLVVGQSIGHLLVAHHPVPQQVGIVAQFFVQFPQRHHVTPACLGVLVAAIVSLAPIASHIVVVATHISSSHVVATKISAQSRQIHGVVVHGVVTTHSSHAGQQGVVHVVSTHSASHVCHVSTHTTAHVSVNTSVHAATHVSEWISSHAAAHASHVVVSAHAATEVAKQIGGTHAQALLFGLLLHQVGNLRLVLVSVAASCISTVTALRVLLLLDLTHDWATNLTGRCFVVAFVAVIQNASAA